ncbi:MAG: DUF3667 domain-containing protein [Bacteroidales bacterium]|jgi:hypothetical protein|nr:DUF3667 domain-containing protein [Bacteroidales bacterium]
MDKIFLPENKKTEKEVSDHDFLICPNCGEPEVGNYCPACGQSNRDFNKPIKEVLGDLLDSINLDLRLLKTLLPFFTKPGFLAEEYFRGRRKRYVPPVRLYMIFSILFFFLVQYTSSDEMKKKYVGVSVNDNTDSTEIKSAHAVKNQTTRYKGDSAKFIALNPYDSLKKPEVESIKEQTLNDTLASTWQKKLVVGGLNAAEKKEIFFNRFLNTLSYVLFLLMPFFALILAMILWKSRMLYVKHLIFSINFHSFIFGISSLLIVLLNILPESISGTIVYLWWGIPVYLMFGIRRFYKRTWVGSFFKALGAFSLYSVVISVVLILVLAITAQGFS